MANETCLLPHDADSEEETEENKIPTSEKYNFVTECFYFAHKAIDLGYQVTVNKLVRLNHVRNNSFLGLKCNYFLFQF